MKWFEYGIRHTFGNPVYMVKEGEREKEKYHGLTESERHCLLHAVHDIQLFKASNTFVQHILICFPSFLLFPRHGIMITKHLFCLHQDFWVNMHFFVTVSFLTINMCIECT